MVYAGGNNFSSINFYRKEVTMLINHKKGLFLIALLGIPMLQAWYGHVVPVTQDPKGDYWILLAYTGGNENIFHVFAHEAQKGDKGADVAQRAWENLSTNTLLKGGPKQQVIQKHKAAGAPWGAVEYLDTKYKKQVSDIFHVIQMNWKEAQDLHPYQLPESSDNFAKDLSKGAGWARVASLESYGFVPSDLQKRSPKLSPRLISFLQGNVAKGKGLREIFKEGFSGGSGGKPSTDTQKPNEQQTKWPKPGTPGSIHFYEDTKEYKNFNNGQSYYEFTNTYNAPIDLDGHRWKTVEHYYQAGKFTDPWKAYDQGVSNQKALKDFSPGQLQGAMRTYQDKIDDSAWRKISLQRMEKALRAKFYQHKDLQQLLLSTGGNILVEDAGAKDKFFGAGGDYNGDNHLGQMLMKIRDEMLGKKQTSVNHLAEAFRSVAAS